MDQIDLKIDTNGFKKLDGNLFGLKSDVLNDFDSIYKNKKFSNNNHKNTSIISQLEDLKNFQQVKFIYNKINQIFLYNNIKNLEFDDIWFVKSIEEIYEPSKLPYVPHIDKIRKLKVMIYLNPVTLSNGPINFLKIDPENYENKRKNLKSNYKLNQENQIMDYDKKDYFACLGSIGTTIFFDTNTPHFAGSFKNNSNEFFRKTLRFNFLKN